MVYAVRMMNTTPQGKEPTVASHSFSDMQDRPAPSQGGLPHHAMVCTCGYEAASTMPTLVAEYARGHIEWEAAKTAKVAR
jgi:hypothetical protein